MAKRDELYKAVNEAGDKAKHYRMAISALEAALDEEEQFITKTVKKLAKLESPRACKEAA